MKKIFFGLFCACSLMFGSCSKEMQLDNGEIIEGSATLRLDINTAGMEQTKGALSDIDEKKVNNLYVLVFNSSGNKVAGKYFDTYPVSGVSMQVDAGNSMMVYVVANVAADGSTSVKTALESVSTESQLKDVVVTMNPILLLSPDSTDGLIAVGNSNEVTKINILPNQDNVVVINLHYVQSRINLNVIDNVQHAGHSIDITGWAIADLPAKTYLFKKSTDAVNPLNGADFATSQSKYAFVKDDSGARITYKTSMYVLENRRGGRVPNGNTPPAGYDPGTIDDGIDKHKAWYAPVKATHMLIYGLYHREGMDSEAILVVIYLGQNNHSDYNVGREQYHTYNVTISGINDIDIDSNIDDVTSDFRVDTGDNIPMDAHPDIRAFQVFGAAVKDQSGLNHTSYATVEIIDENGKTFDQPGFSASWLKLSPVDLYYLQSSRSANDPWQQAATGAGYEVRTRYIPHKSYREANPTKSWSGWPLSSDPSYNDDVMAFADATYRMCYKITDIPFTQSTAVTSQNIFAYADEFETLEGSRTAKIRVSYKQGLTEYAEEKYFTLEQIGALYVGLVISKCDLSAPDISGLGYSKMVIERSEEATFRIYPNLPAGVQSNSVMQWGLSGTQIYNGADKFRNGYFHTPNIIYYGSSSQKVTQDADGTNVNWSLVYDKYRAKYTSGTGIGSSTSKIIEPMTAPIGPAPYNYPDITTNVMHTIYKASAPRYCHEKNRDLNGDGLIDESETNWYLPSLTELQQIWVSQESLKTDLPVVSSVSGKDGKYYWSSTDSGNSTANVLGFTIGHTTGASHTGTKTDKKYVRCVRRIQ